MEVPAAVEHVDGLDTKAVARENQALPGLPPEGYCEHPVELFEAALVPFEERVQDYFGIGAGVKPVPELFELATQIGVIVDFAVEGDNRVAVVAPHRLRAAFEVDDAKTDRSQGDVIGFEDALLVRPPVNERTGHALNQLGYRGTASVGKSGYPAHAK